MGAVAVAERGEGADLVGGHEVLDLGLQLARDEAGVVAEGRGGVAAFPAASVLQRLRQVPVVEGGVGFNAVLEEGVGEPAVEVDAGLVGPAGAGGEDAAPGDGEAAGLEAELLHELHVVAVAVEEVIGDVAGVAVGGFAGDVGEGVPDRGAAAAFADGAFHLVGGGGGAPQEALGEATVGGVGGQSGGLGCRRRQGGGGGGTGGELGEVAAGELAGHRVS